MPVKQRILTYHVVLTSTECISVQKAAPHSLNQKISGCFQMILFANWNLNCLLNHELKPPSGEMKMNVLFTELWV